MTSDKEILGKLLKDLKKEEKDIGFSFLGLKFNPFPLAGLPRHILPPLDEGTIEKIIFFIRSTHRENDYSGLTIVADFGMGKTHLMKFIQYVIERFNKVAQENKIDFSAVTCFIDRPEDTPQMVIHKIIEDIGVDKVRKYIWKIIIDTFGKDPKAFCEKYQSKPSLIATSLEDWEKLFEEPTKSNHLQFLKHFRKLNGNFMKLQETAKEIIKAQIVPDSAIADRYLTLVFSPEEKIADLSWDILAGYRSKRDIQRKELLFLNSVVTILRTVGFKHLYVFVDEFEDIQKLSSAKKSNYLLTLNTLINKESHWSVIVSLTEDVLEEEIKKEPPLYDRLTTQRIEIEPLDVEKGKKLIIYYLNLARDQEAESLHPFTQESIEKIIKISKGNYRSFLVLAHNSLEHALQVRSAEVTPEIIDKARALRGM
jgi:Cdc6-like AAA superfamily ATPase